MFQQIFQKLGMILDVTHLCDESFAEALGRFGGAVLASQATYRDWLKAARVNSQVEWRDDADWFLRNLVVSGPFTITSWTPQQEVVLERNPRYFEEGLPRLDRVVIRVIRTA